MEESVDKSRIYWQQRSLSHLREMRAAKLAGLFPKKEGWRNVVEHELVEAEAADVLGEAVGLAEIERKSLYSSALLHDVYKRREREAFKQKGAEAAQETDEKQAAFLESLGYTKEVAELTQLAGGYSLAHFLEDPSTENLVLKKDLPLADLILHYVDDITLGSDLVPLKERIAYVKEKYKEEDEKGKELYGGRLPSDVSYEVSRQIQKKLAGIIGVDAETLPNWIKRKIEERINAN